MEELYMSKNLITLDTSGQPVASSRDIAEHFGKEHKNVLRDIETLQEGMLNFEQTPMFFKTTYIHPQNGQEYPMYLMNRDGFTLLAMGFTGKAALEWKLKYIEAFNAMESELRSQQTALPQDYPSALRALADKAERVLALESENERQKQVIADFEPIRQYVDTILESAATLTITQIAADYDLSARTLNKILNEEGVQHMVNGQWILYKRHMGMGYTKSKTIQFNHSDGTPDTKMSTQWTQKGRLFLHNILTARGITAIMDRTLAG